MFGIKPPSLSDLEVFFCLFLEERNFRKKSMVACPHSGQMQIAGLSDYRKQTDRAIENIQKSIDCINENFILKDDYRKLER